MFTIDLKKARWFVKKERMYVWLLIFIILINIAPYISGPDSVNKTLPKKILHKSHDNLALQERMPAGEDLFKLIENNKALGYMLVFFNLAAAIAVISGIFLDVAILATRRPGRVLIPPSLIQAAPAWGIWSACKVVILFLWFGYAIMIMEWGVSRVIHGFLSDENLISVISTTASDIMIYVLVLYFVLVEYKCKIISLGLSAKNFVKNVFFGIAGYIATIPVLILVMFALVLVSSAIKYEPPVQPVMKIFLEEKNSRLVMYLAFFVAVFGPIAEETFFRGFLYTAVKKRFGFKIAFFSTSILFALLHANLAGFLPIMVLGMLLAYLFEKTGTLVASCTVHILHNTTMLGLMFLMKGLLK